MEWQICLLVLGLVGGIRSSNPNPGAPIKYPENYCEHFQRDEIFDFVVVGSGPAGSAVARRLAEVRDFKILLLEAGGDPPPGSDIPTNLNLPNETYWNFRTAPSSNSSGGCQGFIDKSCFLKVGKVLGGSSTVNYMMYVRGNPQDFDEVEALGNPGWGYKDMLPYFKKIENYEAYPLSNQTQDGAIVEKQDGGIVVDEKYHAVGGPITTSKFQTDPFSHPLRSALVAAFEDSKIPFNPDYNGETQVGYTFVTGTVDELGYRTQAAKGYLIDAPKNLKVCKNALVTKILFRRKKAKGVEFLYNGKKLRARATKEYIVSGGPFNSPALLERSGIGREDILKKLGIKPVHISNGVGENMFDHYFNIGAAFRIGNIGTQASPNPLSIGLPTLAAWINSEDVESKISDTQLIFSIHNPDDIANSGNIRPDIEEQLKGLVMIASGAPLRKKPPGSTHISQKSDPTITPIITETPYNTREAIEKEVKAQRRMREFLRHPALEPFQITPLVLRECEKFPFNSEAEIMCGARLLTRPIYHATGSVSMGKSPVLNVVDARLRVYGVDNLRVIDSSILPVEPRGNTQVPAYVVGEKGADLIKEDYGCLGMKEGSGRILEGLRHLALSARRL